MLTAEQILNSLETEGLLRFTVDVGTVNEAKTAKKAIIIQQQKLRLKKREISQIKKTLRTEHSLNSGSAGTSGSFLLSVMGQRGLARSWRASSKADKRASLNQTISTYDALIDRIDSHILKLDEAKLKIEQFITDA